MQYSLQASTSLAALMRLRGKLTLPDWKFFFSCVYSAGYISVHHTMYFHVIILIINWSFHWLKVLNFVFLSTFFIFRQDSGTLKQNERIDIKVAFYYMRCFFHHVLAIILWSCYPNFSGWSNNCIWWSFDFTSWQSGRKKWIRRFCSKW